MGVATVLNVTQSPPIIFSSANGETLFFARGRQSHMKIEKMTLGRLDVAGIKTRQFFRDREPAKFGVFILKKATDN